MNETVTPSLVVESLTKVRGDRRYPDAVTFSLTPGRITGFLGPNGSGKSTTLRLIMGLEEPSSGRVLIDGRPLREWPSPGHEIAAVLSSRCAHPRRTGLDHLRWVGRLLGVDKAHALRLLADVGLEHAAHMKVGRYSLGMTQRLSLATALMGDPRILLLDEPMNGLDPEGIAWLKTRLRSLRDDNCTVLLTSHLLKEIDDLVDDLIIVSDGSLVASGTTEEILARGVPEVRVRVDDPDRLVEALRGLDGVQVVVERAGLLRVTGRTPEQIGGLARSEGLSVLELSTVNDVQSAYQQVTVGQGRDERSAR